MKNRKRIQRIATTLVFAMAIGLFGFVGSGCGEETMTTTDAQRNEVAYDWTFYSTGNVEYNCLSYALGNTKTWTWPWGTNNPKLSDVKTYLSSQGYSVCYERDFIGPLQPQKITCYGTTTNITHFAKFVNTNNSGWTGTIRAKWGHAEIFTHSNPNPYKPAVYGSLVALFS
jgi:hypothetical protein